MHSKVLWRLTGGGRQRRADAGRLGSCGCKCPRASARPNPAAEALSVPVVCGWAAWRGVHGAACIKDVVWCEVGDLVDRTPPFHEDV